MTAPISSNQSFSHRSPPSSAGGECDPSNASCSVPAAAAQAPPPSVITLDPVVIEGDLGTRELIKQFQRAQSEPDCSLEMKKASVSCTKAVASAIVEAPLLATPVGPAILALVALDGVNCGQDLRAIYDCENP